MQNRQGASRYFYGVAPTAFRYLRNIKTEGMVRTGANSTLRAGNARGIEFQEQGSQIWSSLFLLLRLY